MSRLIYIAISLLPLAVGAQVQADRTVIGSSGTNAVINGISISSTIGETVVQTIGAGDRKLTQGFQQPASKGLIVFEVVTSQASCITATDGRAEIIAIVGCNPPYQISWSNGQSGATAFDLGIGTYTVTVSTASCTTVEEFTIDVQAVPVCDLIFFNAYSPNGDGINEVWEIENIELAVYLDNEVSVFNRWGQLVFHTRQYNNAERSWNGDDEKGNRLASGTYFYIAKINERDYTGYIELTR